MTKPTAKWVKPLCDFGPLLAFFAAYLLLGLFPATAVLIGTTVLALLLSYLIERRIPIMPLVTAVISRACSGTSVPGPRTCRTMVPCATVSIHTVAASTLGAAGSRFRRTPVIRTTVITAIDHLMIVFLVFGF